MKLVGLYNTRKVRRCELANTGEACIRLLRQRVAAIAAKDYGSIHVYDDKEGAYRCEAFRWMRSVDSQVFTSLIQVRKWWLMWLKKIAEPPVQ